MMRRIVLIALALALTLACGRRHPDDDARKAARSWRATLQLVQQASERHEIPQKYARQVAEAARDELEKTVADEQISQRTRDDCRDVLALAARLGGGGK
jgi:hypothetical protein